MLGKSFGQLHHFGVGIHSQNKRHPALIPSIQLRGVGEISVAAHRQSAGHDEHSRAAGQRAIAIYEREHGGVERIGDGSRTIE